MSIGRKLYNRNAWWSVAILCAILLASLVPIAWMAVSAFKVDSEINSIPPTLLPRSFTFENFAQLFSQFGFATLTINSVIVSAVVVTLSLVIGGSAAYGLSRYRFPGSGLLLTCILLLRMITPASLILPLYLLMDSLRLANTLAAVAIGITVLNLPLVVWLLKPFFDAMPKEVEEAALIDGLGPTGVWWRIAVPMAGSGFKTVALFSFVAAWTDLLIPLTMSTRVDGWTLPAGIMQMQTGFKIYWGALMAGGLYLTIPTFLIAFVGQKYLVQGVRSST